MTTAATQLLLAPRADWWAYCWPSPWYLACTAAFVWAVLRAREKAAHQRAAEDDDFPGEWGSAA
ncbi:hypothetical protein [Streptomyces sp. NPDC048392]|uniref:hypothetical protein n=1 Tax=Streptomyces sp. NPDC048392 TaxID=3365543 RepID=UPI0037245AC6